MIMVSWAVMDVVVYGLQKFPQTSRTPVACEIRKTKEDEDEDEDCYAHDYAGKPLGLQSRGFARLLFRCRRDQTTCF